MSNAAAEMASIPVVILCGGRGVRMGESTNLRPKPLVEIGDRPILLHIMHIYAQHGCRRFVLCLGYKGWLIEEYFHDHPAPPDWQITFADTGENAMTGARVSRVAEHLQAPRFMLTYGDAVTDLDPGAVLAFHHAHGRIGTVTAVAPPSQFGELVLDGASVQRFAEKPPRSTYISGGFFVFERRFLDYLGADPDCILEREPLERLAQDAQLQAYTHAGFWQCMDTPKDRELLDSMCAQGRATWLAAEDAAAAGVQPGTGTAELQVEALPLAGAYLVSTRPHVDSRGWFARVFCAGTLAGLGLESLFVQTNHSLTYARDTLRGLHYQLPPHAETKLIRCLRGSIFDVIVDLRAGSPTFLRWHGERLAADDFRMLYVPPGFAHGYLALEDQVEVSYPSSSRYSPRHERGLRYDDPALGIAWPLQSPHAIVSDKDRSYPLLTADFRGIRL